MSEVVKNQKKKGANAFLYSELPGGAQEAFKRLRTNVSFSFEEDGSHVIGMTSACASEGKSTIAINLCSALAETGKKVVLIDGDVYRPSIHVKLQLSSEKGITEVSRGDGNFSVAVQRFECTADYGFDFIASGEPADDPVAVLNSSGLVRLVTRLREVYDYIIIDMPPIGSVSDVSALARLTDGLLFVVREGHTPKNLIQECVEQLSYTKAKILGFVMNGSSSGSGSGYGYGKSSGYGYGYGYSSNRGAGSDSKSGK